jgi:hypothetical protein
MGMCALYSLKALIEGYDATVQRRVYEYAQDKFSKITNFMLPFSMERVLRKYGIPYEKFS